MISMVQPLHAGNALRLFVEPPVGSLRWRILRKGSGTFSGPDDESAIVAYEGDERVVVDSAFLVNEVPAFYRPFYTVDGSTWVAGTTTQGTPAAIFAEQSTDVVAFLRERLEAGLMVEVQRGNIVSELGYVQVYTAAPAMTQELRMPLVTVHLEDESSGERGIGEIVAPDAFDGIGGDWIESEGWLAHVSVTLIGWSLNSDERGELRRAIRRVVLANLPVFADRGWTEINLSQKDVDAVGGEYPANIYQVMCNFSCTAPVVVSGTAAPIIDVQSILNP